MSNGGAPVATIETQTERVGIDKRGQAVQGYVVYFVTAKMQRGSVFVPKTEYNRDNVMAAVKEHAMMLDSVAGLTVT